MPPADLDFVFDGCPFTLAPATTFEVLLSDVDHFDARATFTTGAPGEPSSAA